jgi:amino acid transporter
LNGIWLSCSVAFLLGLPYLINSTAYSAVISLCIISLHVAYGLLLLCKLFSPNQFFHGPFHLGRYSKYLNTIALIWISLIVILFVLPSEYPVTPINMNYASIAFGTVFIVTSLGYILSARHWFKGPRTNISRSTNELKSSTTTES